MVFCCFGSQKVKQVPKKCQQAPVSTRIRTAAAPQICMFRPLQTDLAKNLRTCVPVPDAQIDLFDIRGLLCARFFYQRFAPIKLPFSH